MDIKEYQQVKDYTYLEYCDYLQSKYGIGYDDYMTYDYKCNSKCKRTKDGLIAHHKKEDVASMLSLPIVAQLHPIEWQFKENIVYCDYLEHLLLHVLIYKYPAKENSYIGLSGAIDFISPELNDLYSGWCTKQKWRQNCHKKVINDKDVYLAILKQLITIEKEKPYPLFSIEKLCRSYNEKDGTWCNQKNEKLYEEIRMLENN